MGKNSNVKEGYDFRLLATCPECGRSVLRSEDTDNSDVPCDKCGAKVNVSIKDETVITKLIKPSKHRLKALNEYRRRFPGTLKTN